MKPSGSKNWVGIILIVFGLLLVIDNFNFFDFDLKDLIFSWHTILLIAGIIILSNSKNSTLGIIFVLVGLFGTLRHLFPFIYHIAFSDLWPIVLILIGLLILLKKKGQAPDYQHLNEMQSAQKEANTTSADVIDETIITTSTKRIFVSENFQGGKITTIVGASQFDLTKSKLAPGEHVLDITCIFGGCTITVPREWKVIVNISAVFGGFDDKRYINSEAVQSDQGVLIIKGAVIFGGGEILSY
ncbi:MAG: DUF5668 domain-containing protein [Bacteroidota bacterium]